MSFLPARMTRVLVGGHQAHLAATITVLHREGAIHLEDYRDPTGTTGIGTPLTEGATASELLVRARGLLKALGADGVAPTPVADPAAALARVDQATAPILETATRLRGEAAALETETAALTPYAALPVELSGLHGLTSVKVYFGQARGDPLAALAAAGLAHDGHAVPSGAGSAFFAVVAARDAAAADKALASLGYTAANVPAGRTGTPAQRLAALEAEAVRLAAAQTANAADLARVRADEAPALVAAEQALAAQVERTQAPLKMGVTATTFHLEGWVPAGSINRVRNALSAQFGDSLYLKELGDAPVTDVAHAAHGHDGHDKAHGHGDEHGEEHHAVDAKDEPPIHLENKGPAGNFEFMLGLLGKPRYWEVDPTKLMLVFFPLFFGLMIGDLALGLIIMGVGFWLRKAKVFGIGGDGIAKPLIYGGLIAVLVGGFVFGEALGIHFVTPEPHELGEEKEISWEEILGLHLPSEGLLHKSGAEHAIDATADVSHAAAGATGATEAITTHAEDVVVHEDSGNAFTALLAPHSDVHLIAFGIPLGLYSKIHDIQALLVYSVLIGIVHLNLGFFLGVRNVAKHHGLKLAVQEKLAWVTLQLGLGLAVWGMVGGPSLALPAGGAVVVGSIALLWMGAQTVLGAGFIAVLEVFGLVGNLLSYTRLAAIGASKAGMVIAFTAIGFETLGGGNVHSPIGWAVYLLGFALIIVLGILAGFLQSLRLQFVEFFQKFFTGGGRPYVPFGRRAT